MTAENKNSSFHAKRQLMLNMELVEPKYYPALRRFFQAVRTVDEQQVVVSSSAAPASK